MEFSPIIRVFLAISCMALTRIGVGQTDVVDTPPMGWNSYDSFGYAVNETEVQQNASFMVKNLKKYGWEYIVVDYVWSCPRLAADSAPNQDAQFNPHLNMDEYGRLLPDIGRFPTSANGTGFRALADSLHKQGLKFGIHLMRGIPKQAVTAKSPILGSPFTADEAFTTKDPCTWLNHMWSLDMKKPAAQAYLNSIFKLYASWHVDFVKVDDLSDPYSSAEIEGYQKAIKESGRRIVLSLSPGPTPLSQGGHVSTYANMWRLLGDLWDNWDQLDNAFRPISDWTPFRGPDHWPDPDMLPLGRLRKYGPNTGPADTDSRLTKDEIRTMLTLWVISKSPLMFGGNLPDTDPYTLSLITNREVLDVNQKSSGNHTLANGLKPVWVAEAYDPHVHYIAMFNRSTETSSISVRLSDIGVKSAKVRDLWLKKDLQNLTDELTVSVAPHASILYRLYTIEAADVTDTALPTINLSGTSYEAESPDNTLSGLARVVDDIKDGKCSGEKLVRFIGSNPQSTLRFNKVTAPKDGEFGIAIVYMSGSHRVMYVSVNGGSPQAIDFPATGGWDGRFLDAVELKVQLKAGLNTLEFGNPKDWGVDLDRIIVHS